MKCFPENSSGFLETGKTWREKEGQKFVRQSPHYLPTVCHERTKGFYTLKCGAAQEMRVGPSKPPCRWRLQTTLSCAGKEPGWWALRKRPRRTRSGMIKEASASEPLMRCRKDKDDVKTGGCWYSEFRENLFTAWAASGIKVARPLIRLLCGTWEPVAPMIRKKSKWRTH